MWRKHKHKKNKKHNNNNIQSSAWNDFGCPWLLNPSDKTYRECGYGSYYEHKSSFKLVECRGIRSCVFLSPKERDEFIHRI